jgi:hypothetical protein
MALNTSNYILALALAAAAVGCGGDGDDGPGGPTDESWVIGIYMAADNNLDRAATNDINEILRAGVPENVSALILVDRAKLGEYGSFGIIEGLPPHSTAKWLRITGNTIEELEDLGEINMADPATVRMFVERLAEEDVERRAAVFWDHGSSFTFGSDDSARLSGAMNVDEIAAQFRIDPEDESSDYYDGIDLVGFDACLMSSVEALSEFTEVAPLYVASAELEPGDGWDYRAIFDFMGGNPALTRGDLAAAIVNGYANYYADNPSRAGGLQVTQSAWLTETAKVEAAIEALAKAYEDASGEPAGNYDMIAEVYSAHDKSTFYNRRTNNPAETTSWVDAGEFLANQIDASYEAIATAAKNLRLELEAIRVESRTDGRDELVMGLSVYFPVNRVGQNSGAADEGNRMEDTGSRLLDGGYGRILTLLDPTDPSSVLSSLQATDNAHPTVELTGSEVRQVEDGADEVALNFRAEDDVMLASGFGLLLFETDDNERLAVIGSSPGSVGVKVYEGEATLPLLAVIVGPEDAAPESGYVGFLARVEGKYSVPVVARAGDRVEQGSLILSDDGTVDGLALLSEDGAWASFPWEDVMDVPAAEIAPRWFTVDADGAYETHEGMATAVSEVSVGFVDLDDIARLSLVMSATDVAGKTTVTLPAPVADQASAK